jgi:hypothetical protein
MLYESALNENVEPSRYGMYPFSRLNMLFACLNSTKLCFETACAIPPSDWFDLPYAVWSLLGHATVVLSRLSLLKAEGWDQSYVRSTIDFSATMDRLMQHLDAARALAENQPRETDNCSLPRVVPQLYSAFTNKLRRIKAAHEAKYIAQLTKTTTNVWSEGTIPMPTDDEFTNMAAATTTFFCDFLDENFWQQFT